MDKRYKMNSDIIVNAIIEAQCNNMYMYRVCVCVCVCVCVFN